PRHRGTLAPTDYASCGCRLNEYGLLLSHNSVANPKGFNKRYPDAVKHNAPDADRLLNQACTHKYLTSWWRAFLALPDSRAVSLSQKGSLRLLPAHLFLVAFRFHRRRCAESGSRSVVFVTRDPAAVVRVD